MSAEQNDLRRKILDLLEKDGKLTTQSISAMLNTAEDSVKKEIENMEDEGVILGYNALIDWDRTDREYVSAVIELKVTPSRDCGFDKIAGRIYQYPEVQSVLLMSSSGYDLMLLIEGKTMKEVANFVARKLATLDGVISTATHFVLKKYKDKGVIYGEKKTDERDQMYHGLQ